MSLELLENTTDTTKGGCRYTLSGELCVFNVAEIKPRLLGLLEPDLHCELDLAQVSEIDSAGVQLLLVAKREAESIKCCLQFVQHSEAVLDMVDLLNLRGEFSDPIRRTGSGGEPA